MGFSGGEIVLDSPVGAYYAGHIVTGRLVFELQEETKLRGIHLSVHGFCNVHWIRQHTKWVENHTEHYFVSHDSYEEYLSLKEQLFGSKDGECHLLKPGMYEYPFTFKLPASCPSSFEGPFGHIRYEMNAIMDKPYAIENSVFKDLRVYVPLDLNLMNCKDPASFEFMQTFCCWCCPSGPSETVVKIPTRGFRPGQVIPIQVYCRNRSSVEIQYFSFRIIKKVTYNAVNQPGEKTDSVNVVEVKEGPVPPYTNRNSTVKMTVPHIDVHNLQACSFIRIEYEFKVTVLPDGCHEYEETSCQIFLGTIPLVGFENNPPNSKKSNPPISIHQSHAAPISPYLPSPYPINSQFPREIGFAVAGHGNSPSIPLLAPGTLPYPVEAPKEGRFSTGASAPKVTPDNENKKTVESHETGNSPYNPELVDKKEPNTDKK